MPRRLTIPRRYRLHVEFLAVGTLIAIAVSVVYPMIRRVVEEEDRQLFHEASALIYQGNAEGLRNLLEGDGSRLASGARGGRPSLLHVAAGQRNLEFMALLLEAGIDVNDPTDTGVTPLFFVYETHDPQYNPMGAGAATAFLMEHGADAGATDAYGRTPLLVAVENGEGASARLLIDAGADVNARREASQGTPLLAAVAGNRPELARMLLGAGADPNLPDWTGESALHLAVRGRDAELIELLLQHGADPEVAGTYHGQTPLDLAREMGCDECVALLVAGSHIASR